MYVQIMNNVGLNSKNVMNSVDILNASDVIKSNYRKWYMMNNDMQLV